MAPPGPWWPGVRVTACTVVAGLVIGVLAALAYRHYTRPAAYRGWDVPEVLLSDDHARIDRWRRDQSRARSHA